jgi:hypothetical protein
MSGSTDAQIGDNVERILSAFGLNEQAKRACSFSFSSRPASSSWKAYTFETHMQFYYVLAPNGNVTQVRSLALGISKENFVLVAELDRQVVLVLRRSKKDDNVPLLIPLRKGEDFERVIGSVRKFNFVSDELTAHASLFSVVDLLRAGAERYFTNRGLFSNYFLKERMNEQLSKRSRSPTREAVDLLAKLGGEFPSGPESVVRVLEALGYSVEILSKPTDYPEYALRLHGVPLDVACVVAGVEALDIKTSDKVAPSYQAVAALQRRTWVILTNGRLWRLYSGRVPSSSTNYFEVDLSDVAVETDARVVYFVSLFSSPSFFPREGTTDVDLVFDEGVKHAKSIEEDLRNKVFDGKLFLNFVKGILNHDSSKVYPQEKLDEAKALTLKLLYRLLFVLYAESRSLLPIENERYKEISLESLRQRLSAFEKKPEAVSAWDGLKLLFHMISKGDLEANMPEYDGELFKNDSALDGISVKNMFLVPALRDLMESENRGIDYQNLGVRHLGSLYEALLEYSVRQAKQSLVIYKEEILDAKFAEDQKQKPLGFIEKGELYLSVRGLARKGTGSYYTPDEIVVFLVKKGLEPHLKAREQLFKADLELLRSSKARDPVLEKKCNEDLLGLKIVDPAMGSGHFLVAAVNDVTLWIISLLKESPDAPLLKEIEEHRKEIVELQRKKGIRLDEESLTDNVILKRLVMKRCVFGVDINPLAVELAKVSLWLDSFTIGTPLTFLDHHIRCGDSLIGLWMKNVESKVFETTLDSWTGTLSTAGASLVDSVVMPADLTVEQVTQSREAYEAVREKTRSLCVLLDMCCANIIDPKLGKRLPSNLALIEQTFKQNGEKPKWWGLVKEALKLSEKYRFFHWELEFPDAFTADARGFDLIVMNPPWDAVKSEDDDFFSIYEPRFRRLGSVQAKSKAKNALLKIPEVAAKYDSYNRETEQKVLFFKASGEFNRRGSGDIDFWKLFLERAMALAKVGGSFSIVVPSALVTNEGAKQLREALFEDRIRAMFEFENARGIFQDIHRSYKFALLVADQANPRETFPAAFYLHDIQALEGKSEQEKFLEMPRYIATLCSPDSLSIPEAGSKQELDVLLEIYHTWPLLGAEKGGWNISLVRELGASPSDSKLFRSDGKGWTLMEGKCFHQFLPDFERPEKTVDATSGLKYTAKRKVFKDLNEEIHRKVRLAYRHVGRSTDTRTLIACIIPPCSFCYQSAVTVVPEREGSPARNKQYYRDIAYLAGILNSVVFDFLIRKRISINLTFFTVYQTPIPKVTSPYVDEIMKIAARMSAADERFREFASVLGVECGPLTMRERIELTAKLNTIVAKHYGLDRKQLEVILQSFEGFEEDKELVNMKEVKWNDTLIRKFNGEMRKRILPYFDQLASEETKVDTE